MMNSAARAGLGIMLTVALLSCGAKKPVASEAAQPPISVALQLDPTPAHVGTERVTVVIRDRTGAPVTGAVVRIAPSFATVPGGHEMAMPNMGLALPTVSASDAGDGTYHADIELKKVTHWTFVVDVSAAGTQMTTMKGLQVQ